ncbi:MAG: acyl carrier protein [Planctomycetota bacterium]|jgi:acyl carrier protein|nr:acyl carrier protein [Blastopirellula sp.]
MVKHTRTEIRAAIGAAISSIAPEADWERLDEQVDFRRRLEIDSFDFLRILVALNQQLGVEFPEADYGRLVTLAGLVAYIEAAEQ